MTLPTAEAAKRKTRPHVLVVEDNPMQQMMMTELLEKRLGYRVTAVSTESAAIHEVTWSSDFALMITDIHLTEGNGLEVVRHVKHIRNWLPVLIVTGSSESSSALEALRARADDYLEKPLDPEQLCSVVERMVLQSQPSRPQVIVAVGAHPDDVEIGVGGTLLKHAARGDTIVHVMLTDGTRGGESSERVREAEEAAARLGAVLVRGHLQDTQLSDSGNTISVIQGAIADYCPSVVYVHSRHDNHQDHRAAHSATLVAARSVPNVYCYQSPSSSTEFQPQRFEEISAYLDAKIDIIQCYRTQVAVRDYLREEHLRAAAVYWGRFAGYHAVEPLQVIRAIHS